MDCFIKNIFQNVNDASVHAQFQKFSKGIFKDRALIKAKQSKGMITVSTTSEYANEFVRAAAETLHEKTSVKGAIIGTANLEGKIAFSNKKQFMGVKQYLIDGEMDGKELIRLCDQFPDLFLALSFKTPVVELKIKAKAPKSAKPSTSEAGPKVDFCTIKTSDKRFVEQFIFDAADFKTFEANHSYQIDEIIIPKTYSSPDEMRKKAMRKGILIRKTVIDGVISTKQATFCA